MNNFSIDESIFRYKILEGIVTSINESYEPIIRVKGGGGYIANGQGRISPIEITSNSIKHTNVYLEDENAVPFHVKLDGWDIPCIKGHRMKFLYLEKEGTVFGDYISIRNVTLTQKWVSDNFINNLYGTGNLGCLKAVIILFISVSLCGLLFFILTLSFPSLGELGALLGITDFLGMFFGIIIGLIVIAREDKKSKLKMDKKKKVLKEKINSLI